MHSNCKWTKLQRQKYPGIIRLSQKIKLWSSWSEVKPILQNIIHKTTVYVNYCMGVPFRRRVVTPLFFHSRKNEKEKLTSCCDHAWFQAKGVKRHRNMVKFYNFHSTIIGFTDLMVKWHKAWIQETWATYSSSIAIYTKTTHGPTSSRL